MMVIILLSTMLALGIATIAYSINISLAQIDPSAREPTTSRSQPPADEAAGVNQASTRNTSTPAVNSTTIGIPPSPTIVGPSNLIASPITSETNNTNSTGCS